MEQQIQDLLSQIQELQEKFKKLEASGTFPKPVEDALRERLRIENISAFIQSAKTNNSESQSVDEAGVASYTVLKNPDVFLEGVINGTVYYVPAWTS